MTSPFVGAIGTVIGAGNSDDTGAFAISAPPTPSVAPDDNGAVRLEITAIRPDLARSYVIEAVPPADASGPWTWPTNGGDASILAPGTTTSAGDLAAAPITNLALRVASGKSVAMNTTADDTTLPSSSPPDTGDQAASTDEALDVQLDDAAAATGTAAAVEREQAAMETTCATGDGEVYWEQTGETTRRKQPIHTDYLANNLKHRYEWSNTRETKASIIYAGTGKNYGGGLSYSVVDGVGFDDTLGAGQENVNHVWNAIWQFNQEEKFCFNAGYSYSMGKKRWRPYKFTGFSRITNDASRWSCDSRWRGPIQIDTWVSRSSTVTFNGWFSIAGVTGSVQQTNTTAHKATYIKKNGVDSAVLCGKGGYPVDVPFVEEMYKA